MSAAAAQKQHDTGTGLVRYDAMCRAIDAAYNVDEVKAIHDQAAMLQAAARLAHNVEAETRAYEIRMRAARKAGELSKKIEKASGGDHKSKNQTPRNADFDPKGKVLERAGISTQQASEWERLSDVPDDKFETALAQKSVRDLIDKPSPVDGDALLLYGMMHDFERRWLKQSPEFFMATMTETMIDDVVRIAPLAAEWLARTRCGARLALRLAFTLRPARTRRQRPFLEVVERDGAEARAA